MNKLSILFSAALLSAAMCACSSHSNANDTAADGAATDSVATAEEVNAQAFATVPALFADSIDIQGIKGRVKISGEYPEGESPAVDSVRHWLANILISQSENKDAHQQLAAGQSLADQVGRLYMADAKENIKAMEGIGVSYGYEADINFGKEFLTDSLVTYYCTSYFYLGGAHGSTSAMAATFRLGNGEQLTFANTFLPDATPKLIDLIRKGLWTQYFNPEASDDGIHSLRDALLIDPDTLPLPATGLTFMTKGMNVTYQQYEIACYAAGMPSCTIPYDSIKPLMTPWAAGLVSK